MKKLVFFLIALSSLVQASDWPRFRGPNGTGVSADKGLPSEVDLNKNVLWSIKIPEGSSSPIIVKNRIFFTGYEGDQRFVLCYDSQKGQLLWRKNFARAFNVEFNPSHGPTTPTMDTDGDNLFAFLPDIALFSFTRDGKELWRTSLGSFASVQGLAASPVYGKGKVVVLVDTPEEAFVAAFDAHNGKQIWKTKRPTGALGSYATPTLYLPGKAEAQVIVAGAVEMTAYNLESGEKVWWARVTELPTAPPFVFGDSVYTIEPAGVGWPPFSEIQKLFDRDHNSNVDANETKGSTAWALSLNGIDKNFGNGDGVVTPEEYARVMGASKTGGFSRIRLGGKGDVTDSLVVWRNSKGMPDLSGALLYQNILYTIRSGIVANYNPENGKLLRQEKLRNAPGDYYASPVAADGKIYLVNLQGKFTVLKAGTDWQILSTGNLGDEVVATPAIADSRLYVRTKKTLYCFGVREED